MKYILLLSIGGLFGVSPLLAEKDASALASVYDDAVVTFFGEVTPERYPEDFADLMKHGADQCYSVVTVAVAQAFAIFCLRGSLEAENAVNRAYRIQISRLLAHYEDKQVRSIIERGFGLDQRDPDTFRFGIHYLRGQNIPDLPHVLERFVALKSKNKKESNKSEMATPRKPSD
ncbi:hypothetical protein [Haloferula sp.]|uniref:hypothetical protein n=1 Tax=Haloferula sp. TaxID=2497595 RepID=UPI00329CCB57